METNLLKKVISTSTEYPFIAQHKEGSFIVLFSSGTKGMVIYNGIKESNPLGTWSDHWNIFSRPKDWEILKEITINFKV